MKRAIVIAALALLAVSCGGRPDLFDQLYGHLGPASSGGTVFYVNQPLKNVLWLDQPGKEMRRAEIDYKVDLLVPLEGEGQVGLVTYAEGAFRVFDARTGKIVREVSLGAPYDRFLHTPDKKHLIASSSLSEDALLASGIIGYLPGQVLVIDLVHFTAATINVGKDVSAGTFVFPPTPAGGTPPTLAAVLVQTGIVLFDYADGDVLARYKPLGYAGAEPHPVQATWSHDARILFAVAEGSNDVFALTVEKKDGALATTLNFLSSSSQVAGVATVPDPDLYDRVVVFYPGAQEVAVLNANSIKSDELHVSVPNLAGYAGIITEENGRAWVAVTSYGGVLSLVDPSTGEIKTSTLNGEIGWTRQPDAGNRRLLIETTPDGREQVTVVSLGTTSQDGVLDTKVLLFPVKLTDRIRTVLFDEEIAYLVLESAKALGRIDLAQSVFTARELPRAAMQTALVGKEQLYVDHEVSPEQNAGGSGSGLATVVDMTPGSAIKPASMAGFLLDGLMDR